MRESRERTDYENIQIVVICLACVASAHWVTAQSAADAPLACVDELAFSEFSSNIAYYLPADARVSIKLGPNDGQASVTLSPADTPLRFELMDAFAKRTRYSATCRGRVLSFIVRYVVEGERTRIPTWQVKFRPPNEILIVSHPVMGSIN
jgi:hypothetical protein